MVSQGWIKLHRKLRENPIYSNSTAVHCWIECLLRAIHTDNAIFLSRQKVELKPGQFCMGREEFGKSVGISGSTAWFWLKRFKLDSMVDIKTSNVGTVVTVLKWKNYQLLDSDVDKRKTADEQRMNTNNNDNNVDNDNKIQIDTNVSIQPKADRPKKKRDIEVDAILQVFEEVNGTIPVDQKPRQWAYLIKKSLTKYLDANKSTLKPSESLRKFLVNKKEAKLPISFNKLQTIYYHLRSTIYKNEKHIGEPTKA